MLAYAIVPNYHKLCHLQLVCIIYDCSFKCTFMEISITCVDDIDSWPATDTLLHGSFICTCDNPFTYTDNTINAYNNHTVKLVLNGHSKIDLNNYLNDKG